MRRLSNSAKTASDGRIRTMRFNICLYFLLFIMIMFMIIWLFQIIFMQSFYKRVKKRDIEYAVTEMISCFDDEESLRTAVVRTSDEYDLCITIFDGAKKEIVSSDILSGQCLIHSKDTDVNDYINKIRASIIGIYEAETTNQRLQTKMLIYGTIVGELSDPKGYILVDSSLQEVGSTVTVLKEQMIYITAILSVVGIALALFMSKYLSEPLITITKSAETLANGDYTASFEGSGYLEVQKLANTLNYAAKEISQIDSLQRDLIANVSHDLRTPLTMVKAYAEMIRDLSGDNPAKREEHLNVIIEETDRLAMLVQDMLDLSKLESGGMQLSYSDFGIRAKLDEILERYGDFTEKRGYNIYFIPDEEVIVHCDVVKIQQVIYNLINNAINYTGSDKKIIIQQTNLFNGVKIEISDTGQGIEEENLHLIFDKYYRAEKHRREIVGTGLGLSICQAVLKKHNFPYGVKSEVGNGTTFWFKILK